MGSGFAAVDRYLLCKYVRVAVSLVRAIGYADTPCAGGLCAVRIRPPGRLAIGYANTRAFFVLLMIISRLLFFLNERF